MTDLVVLTLLNATTGDTFEFAGNEVPEHIMFGGTQRIAVHELVGGGRVVDVLGAQPRDMAWNGIFLGSDALDRALYLDQLRKDGIPLALTWHQLKYSVVISEFAGDFIRPYRIPYNISITVVQDNNVGVQTFDIQVDQQIADDINAAIGLAANMQVIAAQKASLTAIQDKLTTLQKIQKGISSFANATTATINSVLAPVKTIREASQALLGQIDNTVQNVTTLGGLAPNTPVARNAAALAQHANNLNSSAQLVQLDAVLGCVQQNASNAPATAPQTVTVQGGSLYTVAQQQYGDSTLWTAIARANGLTDPQLPNTPITLTIPKNPTNTGGVLNV